MSERVMGEKEAAPQQFSEIPVLVLKEGTKRAVGKEAVYININVATALMNSLKTTLGPKGFSKLLVDSLGDTTITNDGRAILDDLDVEHPVARILVDAARSEDKTIGDGTTSFVVLTGALLQKAVDLLDNGIHIGTIIEGYRRALEKALEELDKLVVEIKGNEDDILYKIAHTSLNSKDVGRARDHFAKMAVSAMKSVAREVNGRVVADKDLVQIIKKQGKSLMESELVKGVVLDKEVVHPAMPKQIKGAKIALLNLPLEVKKTELDAEVRITSPEEITRFLDEEERIIREKVSKVIESGANVVICQKGIDDLAQLFLAKKGIMAVRRVKKSDMEKLAKATGGRIISTLEDLTPDVLGYAGLVEEIKIGEDKLVYVRECKDPGAVSVVIRGGSEHVVDEAERAMTDALSAVREAIQSRRILPGGGASLVELATRIRKYAQSVGGKEQHAIESYAKALEEIAKSLAENAGLDILDVMAKLIASHENGNKNAMVDLDTGEIVDAFEAGIIEPYTLIRNILRGATETTEMILRVDDVVTAKSSAPEAGKTPK
ncbi:MAG: thermosome subunit beta [Candidatus Korarchaeota archaeon]